MAVATKKAKCRYCREGHKPNEQGEHWIVKSFFPARIDIRKCADYVAPEKASPAADTGHA